MVKLTSDYLTLTVAILCLKRGDIKGVACLSQSQNHLTAPQSTTGHYSPKTDQAHLSPLLNQGDLLSYSVSVMALFYSFSETARFTKYFSFTSSQQESSSHILGCLMEILSFAVFSIDGEVADLY